MAEKESQYTIDILAAMTERTLTRLWILIIILVVLLFGSNAAWLAYESQFDGVTVTQSVEQDADNGVNHFVGCDYYGETGSKNDS